METKICLITGANSGIGKASAIEIAKKGYQIVMICRNKQKAEAAQKEISQHTTFPVGLIICDFASQESIRAAAAAYKKQYDRLDVLLNNAGFIAKSYAKTVDGIEQTFAVNHLGYFLLTNLLLNTLKNTPNARVVNVASEAHRYTKFDINNLEMQKGYSHMKAYGLSKLCNIMFSRELSKRLKSTSVTSYSLHPGVVASNFSTEMKGGFGFLFKMVKPFMVSNEKGAETSVFLATDPGVTQFSGKYFAKKTIKKPVNDAVNDTLCKQLWEKSEEMTSLTN
ncbi:MAG: SDR family NAD(P)-dependent oxidoreductase [Bacteroidota bacterium]